MPDPRPPAYLGGGPLLPRWFRALFAWRVVRETGATVYWRNTVTGARSASRITGGHQPIDRHWLRTGEWSPPPTPPSGGTSGERRSIFPHFEVNAPMPRPMDRALIRDALIRARSVLNTMAGEGPEDLVHPARSGILAKREADLTAAIAELDRASR